VSALVSDHPSVRRTAGDEHEPARTRDELLFVDREAILALEHPIELLVLIVHMEPNACIRRSGGLDDAERPIGLLVGDLDRELWPCRATRGVLPRPAERRTPASSSLLLRRLAAPYGQYRLLSA